MSTYGNRRQSHCPARRRATPQKTLRDGSDPERIRPLAKLRPFGSGFLIFSDYGRGSLRLSAIMEIPVIYVFTHDSIRVGRWSHPSTGGAACFAAGAATPSPR